MRESCTERELILGALWETKQPICGAMFSRRDCSVKLRCVSPCRPNKAEMYQQNSGLAKADFRSNLTILYEMILDS